MMFAGIDYVIIAYILISGLVGIWRGFFRELLGMLSWAVAILGMILGVPLLANILQQWITTRIFAEIVSGIIISMLLILLVTLTFKSLHEYIKKSRVKNSDRLFGFIVGIARAFVLMMVFYVLLQVGSPKELENWVKKSALLPPVTASVLWIESKLPKEIIQEFLPEEKKEEKAPRQKTEVLKQEHVKKPVVKKDETPLPPPDEELKIPVPPQSAPISEPTTKENETTSGILGKQIAEASDMEETDDEARD